MKKVNSISLIFVDSSETSATVVAKIDPEDVTFEDLFDGDDENVQPCVFLAWECVRHLNETEEREYPPTTTTSSAIN